MEFDQLFRSADIVLQVVAIDLLLSGDNAIVIALAARHLPPAQRNRAMQLGIAAAFVARVLLTSAAALMMGLPALRLLGGIALTWIAIQLLIEQERHDAEDHRIPDRPGLFAAVATIVVADLAMSVDNVVALAAASQGHPLFLALGLLLSMPFLLVGATVVARLVAAVPLLLPAGGALLGWLAGDIAIGDPLVADWVGHQAPALAVVVPILVAVYVVAESRIIRHARSVIPAPPPVWRVFDLGPVPLAAAGAGPLPEPAPSADESDAARSPSVRALPGYSALARPATPEAARWSGVRRAVPWLTALVIIGCVALFLKVAWMPPPSQFARFVCPDESVVYFRHGGEIIRMTSHAGSIKGVVRFGTIDWGDYDAAARVLGFLPPKELRDDGATSLQINGGRYVNIACQVVH